jgi:tRNA threonylcarbamoyl adenosine modification protein (Sua5/YciO/YrdC/YwlC family)
VLLKLYDKNPNHKHLRRVADTLASGGIVIYPTDSVYAFGCDILRRKAIDNLVRIKGTNPKNPDLSLLCLDMSMVSEYTAVIPNHLFRIMKKNLPGPFTFILPASHKVPKIFMAKKKTVGIRIPANTIVLEIIHELGRPILTTSVHDDDEIIEYTTDPELIYERYKDQVDIVVDGGYGNNEPSTVVDCTGDDPVILRQGLGVLVE